MVAIEVSSNQGAHPATTAPTGHVQRHTCTHGKTQRVCRESTQHIYKKIFHMVIVTGKWTSLQNLVLILISQLEETSWSYKLQLERIGEKHNQAWLSWPLSSPWESFSFIRWHQGFLCQLENHSQTPRWGELSWIICRYQAICKEQAYPNLILSLLRMHKEQENWTRHSEQESLANEKM